MHQSFSKRVFHICMVVTLLTIMLFIFGMIALRYEVEGETNLPFSISKIIIVSTVKGEEKENPDYNWDFNVMSYNDIYMSIDKSRRDSDTEIIEEIKLNNFKLLVEPQKGNMNILKPSSEEGSLFNVSEENIVDEITYKGALKTNVQKLEIGNQGGIILFRYANTDIGEFISNEGDVLKHDSSLLSKIGVQKQDLNSTLSFDITISLKSEKEYVATISLDMPIESLTEEKAGNVEITDFSDVIFKRIK